MITLIAIFTVMLISAVCALTRRNLIHAALLLTLNWAAIAAFYLWAGAEFAAFAQVLVYVGAVSMVVLFAVLLTRRLREDGTTVSGETAGRITAGALTAAMVCGVLGGVVSSTPLDVKDSAPPSMSVRQIGDQLMGPHLPALMIAGLILTVALIGAIVIASVDRPEGNGDHE